MDENGKAWKCTSRRDTAALNSAMAEAFGQRRSGAPIASGRQSARPLFSQSNKKATSHEFVR
ncbi:hypothetical protein D3C86_2229950 [compost metagenome]